MSWCKVTFNPQPLTSVSLTDLTLTFLFLPTALSKTNIVVSPAESCSRSCSNIDCSSSGEGFKEHHRSKHQDHHWEEQHCGYHLCAKNCKSSWNVLQVFIENCDVCYKEHVITSSVLKILTPVHSSVCTVTSHSCLSSHFCVKDFMSASGLGEAGLH